MFCSAVTFSNYMRNSFLSIKNVRIRGMRLRSSHHASVPRRVYRNDVRQNEDKLLSGRCGATEYM